MQQMPQVNGYRLSVASVMKNVFSRLRSTDSNSVYYNDCYNYIVSPKNQGEVDKTMVISSCFFLMQYAKNC